jgi:DNA-binding MarR family transcriptional regulator
MPGTIFGSTAMAGAGLILRMRSLGEILDFMSLLWWLNHGLGSMSKRMQASLGVTGPQRLVLRIIGQMPDTPAGDLARIMRVHPSTLTGVFKRLVERGLLVRRPDPHDGRRALFVLSPLGRSIDRIRSGTVEAAISRTLRKAPSVDIAVAVRVLSDLARSLEAEARKRAPR